MRFGVCAGPDLFKTIKEFGYDYIESGFSRVTKMSDQEFSDFKAALNEFGFVSEAFNGAIPGDINIMDFDKNEMKEYFKKGCSRAQEVGGKILVIGSGRARNIPDGVDPEIVISGFKSILNIAGDEAAKVGMTVVIEPLNKGETNLINTVQECYDFCKELNHPNVNVLADLFHVFKSGESLDGIVNSGKMLRHVHIARPDNDRRMPSIKDIDTCKLWAEAIKKNGYNDRISLEGNLGPVFVDTLKNIKPILDLFR